MTVQELIDRLEEIDDKSQVVLIASGEEGNTQFVSLYDGISEEILYDREGLCTMEESDLEDTGLTIEMYERAIILWPV